MTSTQFGNTPQKNDFAPPNPAVPVAAQQWNNPPFTVMSPKTQSSAFHEEFLKGKPNALGAILIAVGILHIGMGIGLFFTAAYTAILSGIPFWGAVLDIIAGSLTVAVVSAPNMCLIKGSLGLSIVISIISLLGLILNIVDFFPFYCYGYSDRCYNLITAGDALRGIFIFTYLLQFSVSVSISVFACRAQKHPNPISA